MNKKITRLLNFFFVIILFYALIVNMHIQVYAASKGQYILDQPSSGSPSLIYYYGDGKNDYVTYKWTQTSGYQGTSGYFTLSKEDKKKAPDAETKGGYSIDGKNGVDLQEAQKLSKESKKADAEKTQKKVDSGEKVKTGFKYENGELTYTYLDSDKKVHILNYKENTGYNGIKTFEITDEYTDEMKKAGVPKTISESDLVTKQGINIYEDSSKDSVDSDKTDADDAADDDDDDDVNSIDIGDGILGIMFMGAKWLLEDAFH